MLPEQDSEAAQEQAQLPMTDALILHVAREQYRAMRVLLQALKDAAVDCMVLHGLHARLGVATQCQV